ncbi:MAG: tail fiber domain-containing protein [Chitinophagaceae bacterium]
MKRFLLIAKLLLAGATVTLAQSVGINTTGNQPNASSILDVSSTSKGLLIPRMTAAQRIAIASPAKGLLVFQDDAVSSFFYYDGSAWAPITSAAAAAYTAGTGIDITGTVLSAKNTTALWNSAQLQGKDISTTAPLQGQVLLFNVPTNKWVPTTPAAGGGTTYTAGIGIDITNSIVSATNTIALWNAAQLQGKDISNVAPTNGQVLQYDLATTKWKPVTLAAGSGNGWSLTGNSGIDASTNFIGTTDAQPFIGKANGAQVFRFSSAKENTLVGYQAGQADPTGGDKNHIIGYKAGFSNTGFNNHFDGYMAGNQNTSGYSNQFIGWSAGHNNTTGTDNLFMGVSAGYSNTIKSGLHFIGNGAGFANTTGIENHFNGFDAGENNTIGSYNHFDGNHAGFSNTIGSNNHFAGYHAGYSNVTGTDNFLEGYNAGYNNTTSGSFFIGNNAGKANTTGYRNFFVGNESGFSNTKGGYNSFIGIDAGYSNLTGNSNVFVGNAAGKNNIAGNNNVFLGNSAGADEKGSNKLYISNSQTAFPLIYGEFDNTKVKIYGSQEIQSMNSTASVLTLKGYQGYNAALKFASDVNPNHSWSIVTEPYDDGSMTFEHDGNYRVSMDADGDMVVHGDVYAASDKTLKKNISPLKSPLQKLLKLGGYTYNWIDTTRSKNEQIGLIAQEVESQFPQLVKTDATGKKAVAYGHMVPVLVESIKEQQAVIEQLKTENDNLKKDIAAIKAKLGL